MSLNRCPELSEHGPRYRSRAFRAIETVLREDPVLAGEIKTWRSREGWDDDLQIPGTDMMPMISLSPIPRPNQIMAVDLAKINFVVSVQVFVPGSCFEDIDLIWEHVEDAVVKSKKFRPNTPGQETVQAFLCSVLSPNPTGIQALYAEQPAFFPVDLMQIEGQRQRKAYQWGVGTLAGHIRRPA